MYLDPTLLLLIPGLLLAFYAQWKVKSAYQKYSRVGLSSGVSGAEAAERILRQNGNDVVKVAQVEGQLTDNYNPKTEVLSLSEGVYNSASVAAVGIAAHEAGHAMQKKDDYAPLGLRTLVVPTVQIGSTLSMPIFILGLIMSWQPLIYVGIALFALTVVFSLLTLPVEFNASKRAILMLQSSGIINSQEEEKGVRAVLNAAALTYVAAAISAILQLVRLLLLSRSSRSRR